MSLISPALFFFLRIALALQGLLCVHTSFKGFFCCCSRSAKNTISNLIEILPWVEQYFDNIDSLNPRTWYIFPSVSVIFY